MWNNVSKKKKKELDYNSKYKISMNLYWYKQMIDQINKEGEEANFPSIKILSNLCRYSALNKEEHKYRQGKEEFRAENLANTTNT